MCYICIYIRNLNKYAIAMIRTQDHLKQNNLNTYVSIPLSHNSIISYSHFPQGCCVMKILFLQDWSACSSVKLAGAISP